MTNPDVAPHMSDDDLQAKIVEKVFELDVLLRAARARNVSAKVKVTDGGVSEPILRVRAGEHRWPPYDG